MECADILFLSDENIGEQYQGFLWELIHTYHPKILVLGRGIKGAAIYVDGWYGFHELPAVRVGEIINTVGAGDAIFSSFVHYYAKGMEPIEALKRAQIFASAKISSNGAAKGFVKEDVIEEWYGGIYL